MNPVALELQGLKAALPDLVLRPGATIVARVMERHGKHGMLNIAGTPLVAELPDELRAGDRLRLRIEEVSASRVLLKLFDEASSTTMPAPIQLPLPDGQSGHARVEDDAEGGGGERDGHALTVSYESPRLGGFQFRLHLTPGGLTAAVSAPAGQGYMYAREDADALAEALGAAVGRPIQVSVSERYDPIDVYA